MKKQLLALMTFLFISGSLFAQERHCAADEIFQQQIKNNAEFARNQEDIERHTRQFATDFAAGRVSGNNVVIPCIVHVVYANAQENISTAQVQSQIDRLNEDFSATNSDYNQVPSTFTNVRSGDTNIRFELIEIRREANSRDTWGTNDAVKASYPPVEPSRILNMWVADIGGGILGYAQFPGGSPSTDGVVMSPQYFGDATKGSGFYLSAPFNRGRTATHEVGHWLNLRHIWGDGNCSRDDFVNDTPVAGNPNYGCPSAGTNSCNGGLSDMFMNYMDYVDDACMFMFSAGQDARMQATFANGGGREGFLLDPTYNPGGGSGGGGGTTCNDTEVTLALTTDNYGSETTWSLVGPSGTVATGSGYGNNQSITETFCLADGDYTFTINDSYGDGICCQYGNGSYGLTDGSTSLASGGSFGSTESTSFTIGGGTTPDPCDTPTGLSASNVAETTFTLSWNAVSGAVSYDVDINGTVLNSTTNSLNLTGASAGTTYSASVRSNCADGSSAYSSAISVTTDSPSGGGGGGTGTTVLASDDFEGGFGNWTDGGNDCARYTGQYVVAGNASIQLRDNSGGASGMFGPTLSAAGFSGLNLNFSFQANSMENGEDFIIYYNDGSGWSNVASYARGTDFDNRVVYTVDFNLDGNQFNLTNSSQFAIVCDASANADQVYIDDVTITGIGSGARVGPSTITEVSRRSEDAMDMFSEIEESSVSVYPNPASVNANLRFSLDSDSEVTVQMFDMQGKMISAESFNMKAGVNDRALPIQNLKPGLYFVKVDTNNGFKQSLKLQVR